MRSKTKATTKLPKQLIEELGVQSPSSFSKRGLSKLKTRKDRRKDERLQKKSHRSQNNPKYPHAGLRQIPENDKELGTENELSDFLTEQAVPWQAGKNNPKSSLKKIANDPNILQDRSTLYLRPKISQAVKDRIAADDAAIAALEKKLGLKGKKKLPKSFEEDGLDVLVEGLDEGNSGPSDSPEKRKRDEEEHWLENKRKKARGMCVETKPKTGASEDLTVFATTNAGKGSETETETETDESDFDESKIEPIVRIRENPYIAPPGSGDSLTSAKYVPPSLRGSSKNEKESLSRLRRQIQGLLNRLSEANILSILNEIESIYQKNPRHHVTSIILDLLLGLVSDCSALTDTFLILHAGFVAAAYKIIGTDIGAMLIQRLVEALDRHSKLDSSEAGKEEANLIAFMSQLYNFQVVGSKIVFDYIQLFLEEISENNTELLLKIIKNSGPQLRQDDPSALKDIVLLLQKAISRVGESTISVRTKFMIETINNLKNNRVKTAAVASAISSEHILRMKKILGSLNTRATKGTEPLRVGLKDIKDCDKTGKWWLVGASWKNQNQPKYDSVVSPTAANIKPADDETFDLLQLAKEQRMNTDVRRAIFISIMSASDYRDAHLRLKRLRLKKTQEIEIPRVLIHCSGAEEIYNPYYTLLAKKFSSEHKLKMAFQFGLWDLFKSMGEFGSDDEEMSLDEDKNEDIGPKRLVNLAKMFGAMLAGGQLGIGVLKNLRFTHLQPKTSTFLELLFITIMLNIPRGANVDKFDTTVNDIFTKSQGHIQMAHGLQYFLQKVVSRTDVASNQEDSKTIKQGCKIAIKCLQGLDSTPS
ncbi:MAG: suppressor of glycerol defect [Trizodia sp. TS-e1964]|nr:MAG: suppressor of glycerol defect [Trizodia sp. TS-e1964]